MTQHIILCDVGGYRERLRALQDVHPHVTGVTPHDKPCDGFTPVTIPDEWLPTGEFPSYTARCWHGCGRLALAAVAQLGIEADAYWFIESDCVAPQERWAAMLADHADNQTDGSFICPRLKCETLDNHWWTHPGTPAWAKVTHLNAIYRLTRRAVEWELAAAVEMRECFGEMITGSVIHRAGGSIGRINLNRRTHMNNQTMKADQSKVLVNPLLVNHPVKANTYSP